MIEGNNRACINGVGRFVTHEADRICERKNTQMRMGWICLGAGLVCLISGVFIQSKGILQRPVPALLILAGLCMLPAGVMVNIKMAFMSRNKIIKQLESLLMAQGLSVEMFDQEMEKFGAFNSDQLVFATDHFVIQREPLLTKAVNLNEAFWICGAFVAQNANNSEKGYMLYDGTGSVDEHTKEGYSRVRGMFQVEYYDEDGEQLRDGQNKKCCTKTGKERQTKELIQEIHRTHPWIFMGREQMDCIDENNMEKAKELFEARKEAFVQAV